MLHVDHVSKRFGNLTVLDRVCLTLAPGEIHGLLGLNGSGKTTLLNILSGNPMIRKSGGYSGEVSINGRAYLPLSPAGAVAAGIGMVRQESALIPELSVAGNIGLSRETTVPWTRRWMGNHLAYVDNARQHADVSRAFNAFDITITDNIAFPAFQTCNRFVRKFPFSLIRMFDSHAASRYAEDCIATYHIRCESAAQKTATLSGGNQQKVCIAAAIASQPQILVVSEPTRGIDVSAKEVILNLFLRIHEARKTTLIVASGELEELKRICDRIVVTQDGRIRAVLPPSASDLEFARHLC